MKDKFKGTKKNKKEKKKQRKEQLAAIYTDLKKSGLAVEQQLNQHIQDLLDRDDLVKFANQHSDFITNNIKSLQKYIEVFSNILLLPTKNDIANVAKVAIQTEEKVDKLDERMNELANTIRNSLRIDNVNDEIPIGAPHIKWSGSSRKTFH
ncbi:hypothetical protein [Neobacillus kokaensis]|uniref:LXG domain-containing protein n=1 Tax=Neobacillus kokaensis TaxID=2759023 RepID=A0ABQ3NAB0_9BACI|nr:hypothetical protein [Neobacillus kokaensis]GHH98876.1 hypothetical protein AM1BK_24190 [Neobacillus kokaensis]